MKEQDTDPLEHMRYNEVFVPYRDGDAVLWAVYDVTPSAEFDALNLFSQSINAEAKGKHIKADRLEILAETYNANCLFTSQDDGALQRLQEFLGEERKASDFLGKYGFDEDNLLGFVLKKTPAPKSAGDSNTDAKPQTETSAEFNTVGTTEDKEDWDNIQTARLLYRTLVFRDHEIDENLKGMMKEGISDALVFHAAVTDPSAPSVIASICGLTTIGLMGYNVCKEPITERNEALRIWARYVSDLKNPEISNATAHETLRENMRDSPLTFEGVQEMPYSEFKKQRARYERLARNMGYFDELRPLTAQDVMDVGDRLRNTSRRVARSIGLTLNEIGHYGKVGAVGVSEIATDLNVFNAKTRAKLWHGISRGFAIFASDAKNYAKRERENKDLSERQETCARAMANIETGSEIIESGIDVDKTGRHIRTIAKIKEINTDKKAAKFNYGLVSVSMGAQLSGVINGILRGDLVGAASNAYGIFAGIGAWAQTGVNVHNLDAVLHSRHAEEAMLHEHYYNMKDRLIDSYIEQHSLKKPDETDDNSAPSNNSPV